MFCEEAWRSRAMSRLHYLLLIATWAGADAADLLQGRQYTQCGVLGRARRPKGDGKRIVHGEDSDQCVWRWQVSLSSTSDGQFCGGTLISPEWVLTAAHCVWGVRSTCEVQNLRIGAGAWHRREQIPGDRKVAVQRRVVKIFTHPLYQNNVAHDYDFALMKLDKPVPINHCIGVACLPRDLDTPGANCNITGWGTLNSSGPTPDLLQEAPVSLLSNEVCEQNYTETIAGSMLCARGHSRTGITDTCQGDSGGPLVCQEKVKGMRGKRFVLRGVTSWGQGCAYEGFPGVYGRVVTVLSWINDAMQGKIRKAHAVDDSEDDYSNVDFRGAMWSVLRGPCSVDAAHCLLSPNYPNSYGDNQQCKVAVNAAAAVPIEVVSFSTEIGFDKLYVDCKAYHRSRGPEGVVPTNSLFWSSDASVVDAGWRLCPRNETTTTTSTTTFYA